MTEFVAFVIGMTTGMTLFGFYIIWMETKR